MRVNAPTVSPHLVAIVQSYSDVPGGLIPALHAIQREASFIDPALVQVLAETFNLSAAEVHGVITFYKDFRTAKPAGPLLQVCRAEACQARGGEAVHARAAELVAGGAAVHLDATYCLGNCALGPSVAVEGRMHARVDATSIESIISSATRHDPGPAPVESTGTGTVVYVPRDAAARAVGADTVAALIAAHPGVRLVRNGSRGMLWAEPLVEVTTPAGRVAYGPVGEADVAGLFAADFLTGADHPLRLGFTEDIAWMKRQQRLTFRRVGVIDPRSTDDIEAHGGLTGLRAALAMSSADVISAVTASGLRGRGGAAFPTGIKWNTVAGAPGPTKYIVCNADEGDSGTFADRMLMEGDPLTLVEGMIIAGYAVGATEGYIYIRSEYPDAIAAMAAAIRAAEDRGWLGDRVLDHDVAFRLHVRVGAGAYICGEETAMLESIEGRRGVVRAKPPLPAHEGLFGKPTAVNNVISLATIPVILSDGAAAYEAFGSGRSRGTTVLQLAGNIARGGIVETAFGVTLGELIDDFGGGTATGRPVKAVQVGGPLGAYLPREQFGLPIDYEAFAAANALVGHGGVVVFDDTVNMAAQSRFAMEFCAHESCGKCTPCRIGAVRGVEVIDKIMAGRDRSKNIDLLIDLCDVMADGSLCAMGGLTPMPVRSALTYFPESFDAPEGALQ